MKQDNSRQFWVALTTATGIHECSPSEAGSMTIVSGSATRLFLEVSVVR